MTYRFKKIHQALRKLGLSENGAATVEFVLVFPFFLGVFLSAFEVAMMNARAVMLERATDISVRAIRLGSGAVLQYDDVKANICEMAALIPDCSNVLRIELQPVDPLNMAGMQTSADCIRRDLPIQPVVKFKNGAADQMMLIRVCAVVDPFFPNLGVGRSIPVDPSGGYRIIASSAFVNEPT